MIVNGQRKILNEVSTQMIWYEVAAQYLHGISSQPIFYLISYGINDLRPLVSVPEAFIGHTPLKSQKKVFLQSEHSPHSSCAGVIEVLGQQF